MKPVAERRRPFRGKGMKRGPRPPEWVSPMLGKPSTAGKPAIERFFKLVQKGGPGECWTWMGAKRPYGYGNFYKSRDFPNVQAHRMSLEFVGRTPGPDDAVDHLCKNPSCVNPDHLRVVTHRQNSLENNASPFAKNAAKTHCAKGHHYNATNTAIIVGKPRKNTKKVVYGPIVMRVCLACYPASAWRFAVIQRASPAKNPRKTWVGPQAPYTMDAEGTIRPKCPEERTDV